MDYRIEHDSIGELNIPANAYYGINSMRAANNFDISGQKLNVDFIKSIVLIKKAAAIANNNAGSLSGEKADAIIKACDEILEGKFVDQFIIDPMQGGAGTSMNMNANEVIANRAIEILGGEKGNYTIVHPNDDVNLSQSTNDVIPSALKLCTSELIDRLNAELKALFISLLDKSTEFIDIIKIGRTQMQDAIPISLGQEFFAYADSIRRSIEDLDYSKVFLKTLNMGGTAIGTGLNASPEYSKQIVPEIAKLTGIDYVQADNLIDATQNVDAFVRVSGSINAAAVALSKIANDLRLLSSGPRSGFGEITLPAMQSGSSIMPAKINPVIPEIVNQVAFMVMGNNATIAIAAESGQLELNAFIPVIAYKLFESLISLTNAVKAFREKCINGIIANSENCNDNLEKSTGIVTALCPFIGYEKSVAIAKKAIREKKNIRDAIIEEKVLTKEELEKILDPKNLI